MDSESKLHILRSERMSNPLDEEAAKDTLIFILFKRKSCRSRSTLGMDLSCAHVQFSRGLRNKAAAATALPAAAHLKSSNQLRLPPSPQLAPLM